MTKHIQQKTRTFLKMSMLYFAKSLFNHWYIFLCPKIHTIVIYWLKPLTKDNTTSPINIKHSTESLSGNNCYYSSSFFFSGLSISDYIVWAPHWGGGLGVKIRCLFFLFHIVSRFLNLRCFVDWGTTLVY